MYYFILIFKPFIDSAVLWDWMWDHMYAVCVSTGTAKLGFLSDSITGIQFWKGPVFFIVVLVVLLDF